MLCLTTRFSMSIRCIVCASTKGEPGPFFTAFFKLEMSRGIAVFSQKLSRLVRHPRTAGPQNCTLLVMLPLSGRGLGRR